MSEYVGFDVSKEETSFCVKSACGRVLARGKTLTSPETLFQVLKEHCLCPERVVMETGTCGDTDLCGASAVWVWGPI